MAESGGSSAGFGTRYPYYYGPEGRLVLVDSASEAVNRGSTTIGIKTPVFALISSQIKPTKPLVEPAEKIFTIDGHIGYIGATTIMSVKSVISYTAQTFGNLAMCFSTSAIFPLTDITSIIAVRS